ncbi:MAG: large subunit ribosomal protein [Petroclostridium sp.]|uniref:50S ribosomal protein L4 n=1 Tax=Petroclostridium xylanilyticum TaxID=1792311 RepID=UPI000B97F865|nr:50S ribosomal protein L4 [Petroclostridium xylanilyticum]MBZ4645231.1 rplD [Clostridia bacterium]MDK2809701.1 large subunit ribosomal protein [Petroclostridium sp.]
MPKVALYDMSGKQVGDIELNDSIFGVEVNKTVLHQVVVNYLANQRQGTQNTKTRAEVRGGGIKPWRQKGTGRARQGSIRAPQWVKGGIALGPKPRSYRYSLNKKVKRLALKSALSSKVLENDILVLDNLSLDSIKTKEMVKVLDNLKVDSKALIVLPEKNEVIIKSARNIPGVTTTLVSTLNVYDILNHDKFIVTKDAVAKIEEVYA